MMRAGGISRWVAVAVLLLGSAGVAPAPAASPPDAETIFSNVRRVWSEGAYPRYGTYATIVEFHTDTRRVARTWDTIEDFRHATVFARKFSREELANPSFPPGGFNIAVPFLGTLNKPQPDDPVGHVAFAVDQDYGISPIERRFSAARSASGFTSSASTLPVIGHTGVKARDYDVRLIETLQDERGAEYHLALVPLHDPKRYRLRELWVDARTWLVEEAVVAGIGSRSPLTDVSWRIEFRQIQGATYVVRETALSDVDYGKAGTLRWLTVRFDEFAPSAQPSGWRFMLGSSDDTPQTEP